MLYYDCIAKGYDELYGDEQIEKAKKILENLKPGGLLLDVGAGSGLATREFEEYFTCIALDPSEKLLSKYKGYKMIGMAEELPFLDNYFDVVISITALHHSDLKKALEEIKRVVRDNGQIAITILKKSQVNLSLFKDFKKIDIGKDWLFLKL